MVSSNKDPQSQFGITGFGAYIPRFRLPRAEIAAAHRWMLPKARAKGSRAFCSWDEDAMTMAVEAARAALNGSPGNARSVAVASTTMPNADLQHSAIIANVLELDESIHLTDLGYSQRAGTSGLISALVSAQADSLFVASDCPRAKPASPQEMQYGAGAAAFTLGSDNVLAHLIASESSSSALVDHFRPADARFDYYWDERWVREEGHGKIVVNTVNKLLEKNGLNISDIQYLVFGTPTGAVSMLAKNLGFNGTVIDVLSAECGFTGTADSLLGLIAALEQAAAGERILVLGFGLGCDALLLEATSNLAAYQSGCNVSEALAEGYQTDSYLRMLSFQGLFEPDWGMRGEKEVRTALTELYRSVDQIWKFQAGRCESCNKLQFPQLAYCISCRAPAEQFTPVSLADRRGHVLTYTADWLTHHPSPPLYAGFVQFDDEARLLMEMVDVGPDGIAEGTPMKMVFRVKDRDALRGWTRYVWKATPDVSVSDDVNEGAE